MLRCALFLGLLAVCFTALQCTASEAQTSDVNDPSLSALSGVNPPVNPPTGTGSSTPSVVTPQHSAPEASVDTAATTTTQAVTENTEGRTAQGLTTHVEANDASPGLSQTTTNTQSSPSLPTLDNPQQSQDHRTTAATVIVKEGTQRQIKVEDQQEDQRETPPQPQPATTDDRDSLVQAQITPNTRETVDAQDTTLLSTSGKGTQGREASPSPSTANTKTLSRANQAQTVAAGLIQTGAGTTKTSTYITKSAPQLIGQDQQKPTPGTSTVSVLAPKSNPTAGQNIPARETTTQTTTTVTSGKVKIPQNVPTTTTNATAVAAHPANPKTATSSNTASVPGDKPATNTPEEKETIQAPTLNSRTFTAASSAPAQTSITSTAEPAKKESIPPGNLSQKMSKALESLDNKDSSNSSLSLFAFAELSMLVLLAVAPAF